MTDPTTPSTVHDLLLAVAGRVDDDLLAHARELVSVGEDGHALDLVTATLIAEATPVPAPIRGALVAAARWSRAELDAEAALPAPAEPDRANHRFTHGDGAPVTTALQAVAATLAGCEIRVALRCTPAGTAPGPVPHPVVLVTVGDEAVPELLAHQVATAVSREIGPVSVEVFGPRTALPAYHRTALAAATRLPAGGPAGPQAAGAVATEIASPYPDGDAPPDVEYPGPRPPDRDDPLSGPLSAPLLDPVLEPTALEPTAVDVDPLDTTHPLPGRRAADPEVVEPWASEWTTGSWTSPDPPAAGTAVRPVVGGAGPSWVIGSDDEDGPDEQDDRPGRAAGPARPGRRAAPDTPPDGFPATPRPFTPPAVPGRRAARRRVEESGADAPVGTPPSTSGPAPGAAPIPAPHPATLARLSGTERDLLAQLHAELAARETAARDPNARNGNPTREGP